MLGIKDATYQQRLKSTQFLLSLEQHTQTYTLMLTLISKQQVQFPITRGKGGDNREKQGPQSTYKLMYVG